MARLLAFSDTMRLKRVWSFRLAHLVQGRASMAVATGPGVLFLRSIGDVRDGSTSDGLRFSPQRLLAWQPNQNFIVHSALSFESMYMGGVTIAGQSGRVAIFDAKGPRGGFGGALRFIPMLLLPV